MRWSRAVSSRFQAGTGHGSGFHGAGWSAIRNPAAAGSRGCSIGVFREGKMEIPVYMFERRQIENQTAETIARNLTEAFDRFCTPTAEWA